MARELCHGDVTVRIKVKLSGDTTVQTRSLYDTNHLLQVGEVSAGRDASLIPPAE